MDDAELLNLWSIGPTLVSTAFVFAFGACVGSFLNVVVHRLPKGMSLLTPPSRCPACGRRLSLHENLPVFGWFLAGGRCRSCGVRIGLEYPLVELGVGVLFAILYVLFFETRFGPGIGGVTNPWWHLHGAIATAPAFLAVLGLCAALVAASLIDARSYLIPGEITRTAALLGVGGLLVQSLTPGTGPTLRGWWAVSLPEWPATITAFAGMAGLALSWILLRTGRLTPSFADYDQYLEPGETFARYPHARREMIRELLFLAPCMAAITASMLLRDRLPQGMPPLPIGALGASAMGFLVGGGVIWAIRILGSLSFGREAMGMGDVHLMAAVGATLGWVDPLVALVPGIVLALAWTMSARGVAILRGRSPRELPLGPYLAIGTLLVVLLRPAFVELGRFVVPAWIDEARPGLFTSGPPSVAITNRAAEPAPSAGAESIERRWRQKGV
ncbi:MAG: prepilin peptidase [Phycisphaerae bacterium]|nr:prepilin peptidase [Phycisphaerae bacterium]